MNTKRHTIRTYVNGSVTSTVVIECDADDLGYMLTSIGDATPAGKYDSVRVTASNNRGIVVKAVTVQ